MKSMEPHVKAMELCEAADKLKDVDLDEARKLYCEAFLLERETALSVKKQPSRSVLLKSAIYIAKEAGLDREAELLIGLALSEPDTSEFIRSELRDLLNCSQTTEFLNLFSSFLPATEYQELTSELAGDTLGVCSNLILKLEELGLMTRYSGALGQDRKNIKVKRTRSKSKA